MFPTVLIVLIEFLMVFGQNELMECEYRNDNLRGYTCDLTVNNPAGLNNFKGISGEHLKNWEDKEVRHLNHTGPSKSITANIPSIICAKFPNLKYIYLNHLKIQRIDSYSFSGCEKVLELYIHSNNVRTISANSFVKNQKLSILSLTSNDLSSLPENLFINQHDLVELSLDQNQLRDLPKNIFQNLENLEDLRLSVNVFKNLSPEWFKILKNLKFLALYNNLIANLPTNVFSGLTNLEKIYINNLELLVLHSSSFGVHKNLKKINVDNNEIFAIEEKLFDKLNLAVNISIRINKCANKVVSGVTSIKTELRECFNNYHNHIAGNADLNGDGVWITWNGRWNGIPANAVVGGLDDKGPTYVARVEHWHDGKNVGKIVGKYAIVSLYAHYPYNHLEHRKSEFEILTQTNYVYVDSDFKNMIPGGNGQFMCRAKQNSYLIPGKFQKSVCYIPYNGKEHEFRYFFSILKKRN